MFATGMAVTFLVTVAAIDAVWTPARARATVRAIGAGDAEARTTFYQVTIGYLWPMTGIAALILGVGFGGAAFGLRAPELSHLHGAYAGVLAGCVVVAVVANALRRVRFAPMTRRDQTYFALAALTAGFTEEILYRALPFAILATWWPGGDPRWYAVIAGALFGLARLYRGAASVLLDIALGLVYATTGSLVPAMVLHAIAAASAGRRPGLADATR